jgi:nucleotide-binding universal stress UspA family protein
MENTRTLLVPVDFSEAAKQAFETALVLHAHPGTTLVVVHVVDSDCVSFAVGLGFGQPDELAAKARTHAELAMRRFTETVEIPEGVEIERVVAIGRPVFEIIRLSRELEADLVVLGSPPPILSAEHALFGSIAERVLRAARCPVLVIPGPAGEPAIPEPEKDVASGAPSTT